MNRVIIGSVFHHSKKMHMFGLQLCKQWSGTVGQMYPTGGGKKAEIPPLLMLGRCIFYAKQNPQNDVKWQGFCDWHDGFLRQERAEVFPSLWNKGEWFAPRSRQRIGFSGNLRQWRKMSPCPILCSSFSSFDVPSAFLYSLYLSSRHLLI